MNKRRVHELLQPAEEGDTRSRVVDLLVLGVIAFDIVCIVLDDVAGVGPPHDVLVLFEKLVVAFFALEYALRLWSCTADERWSEPLRGRLRYALTPMALVDLLATAPALVYFLHVDVLGEFLPLELAAVRVFRVFRFLRILRLARFPTVQIIGRSLWRIRRELWMLVTMQGTLMVVAALLLYAVEHESEPRAFGTIQDSLWWSVVTLTTVGYGDIVPVTPAGRLIGALVMVCGVALLAIPTGMIGATFVDEMNEERERRRRVRDERMQRAQVLRDQKLAESDRVECPHCRHSFALPEAQRH